MYSRRMLWDAMCTTTSPSSTLKYANETLIMGSEGVWWKQQARYDDVWRESFWETKEGGGD